MICTISAAERTRSMISSGIMVVPFASRAWIDLSLASRRASGENRHRHARATFVPRTKAEPGDARVLLEHLAHAGTKRAGSLAVNDAKLAHVGAHGGIECLHHLVVDFIDAQAAQ